LRTFDLFCKNQGLQRDEMIEKYSTWFNQDKPDLRSILLSLDKFVQFMNIPHDDIFIGKVTFKKKSPKTIHLYFGFIKSYLRKCHDIKLTTEDIQDFVQFPKPRKEPRRPISLDQLKKIMTHASPKRTALYYVLVSSGMRLGEALTLRRSNLHLDDNPSHNDWDNLALAHQSCNIKKANYDKDFINIAELKQEENRNHIFVRETFSKKNSKVSTEIEISNKCYPITEKYLVDFILEHGWLDYKSTLADIAYLCKIKTGHGSINQIRNHVYMLTSSSAPFEIIKDPNTKKKIIKKR
jgi:integrase